MERNRIASAMRRSLKRWVFRLITLFVSTGFALLLGEVAVRIARPQYLVQARSDIWIPHDGLGHRLAPNVRTTISTGERTVQFCTDGNGHRISASGPKTEGRRILALGDSFVEALAVEYEQTMTARLEHLLPGITVVNAGVSATSPDRYLLRGRLEMDREACEQVLVFLYPDNDVRGDRQDSYPPRNKTLKRRVRLPRSLSTRELTTALVYPVYTELRTRSHLAVLAKDTLINQLIGLGLTCTDLPPVYLKSESSSPSWETTADICKDIDLLAKRYGASTLFILLPADYVVDESIGSSYIKLTGLDEADVDMQQPTKLMAGQLAKRGLRFIDTTDVLVAAFSKGIRPYGSVDRHFSPEGHDLVAKSIAPLLAEMLSETEGQTTVGVPSDSGG